MPNKDERGAALRTSSDLPFEQRVDTEPPVDTEAMLKDSIKGLRDTPLPLKIAASIPDTSTFDTAAAQIANMQPKMSNAVLSTAQGADPIAPQSATVPPTPAPQATLETAPMTPDTTVNTPPGAVAGTAPREMKLETGKMSLEGHSVSAALAGAGGVTVNADVLHGDRRAITTITQNLATNTFEIRDAVRALVQATQAQIKQLEEKRLNDPETAELIEFLKWLAIELSKIVENIERAIAQPGSEPMFLGMAGTIAYDLKLGLLAAVEKNRVKIWEGGAVVGAACLLAWLTGETPAEILRILWGKNK